VSAAGATVPEAADEHTAPATVGQLARYFLRLGATAFGGPAAHIAIMEDDIVVRRRWLTRSHFMDMLAATQLVPGPNSTEMAIHIGYVKAGMPGLLVAGACFILPALLIVLALSTAYVAYGALPAVGALFYGIQPVIVAIVVQATYRLGRAALKSTRLIALGVAAFLLTLLAPIDPVWIIAAGGLAGVVLARALRPATAALLALPLPTLLAQAAAEPSLWRLALFFLKVGGTLLGSGYLLISYLQNDLVNRFGWLTPRQLVDAIAVGQMTPGPVFTTAAFVGYVVRAGPTNDLGRGIAGGLICALAIFLPSFIIVALMGPLLPWLRRSVAIRAFLDGVNAAVVGTIAATTWSLFQAAAIDLARPALAIPIAGVPLDVPATALAVAAVALLVRDRAPNSTILIAAGAALGLAIQALAGGV
jgi:chromate transporter